MSFEFRGKTALVCGLARSGVSSAILLNRLGARVIVQDLKSENKLTAELDALGAAAVKNFLGANPDEALLDEADYMILSPGIPNDLPFVNRAREKGIPVLSEVELAYSVCKAPVIAVTGTNGKTTTTALTGEMFLLHNKKTAILGNIGTAFTKAAFDIPADGCAVVEISSFQLENIYSFKPRAAAVLNIAPDHLDRHKTFEAYIALKERIFENQTKEDFLILNYDDPICRAMAGKARSKTIFFSQKEELSEGVFLKDSCIKAVLAGLSEEIIHRRDIKVPGNHILENIMASTALALCLGLPADIINKALTNFRGVAHRLEYVATINDIEFYNDSKATNPHAAITGLKAMQRPVVLIGGGYDKDADFADWVKLFEGRVKHAVLIGAVADKIAATLKAHNFTRYDKVNSLKDAVELSFTKAEPGDAVLLSPACASWDMFDNFEQRGDIFREFVLNLCYRGECHANHSKTT